MANHRKPITITGRADKITPFYVMELLEKAKELERNGLQVVHMEVGEPDFASPLAVREAAMRAISDNRTFYTHSLGIPELREMISEHYFKTNGLRISPERIIITNGTSGAFLLLSVVLLDKERSLGISDPGYPCYKNFALVVGADIVSIPINEETFFEVTVDHLKALTNLPHALLVSTPTNPTGIIYREKTLRSLYEYLLQRDKVFIVDELYNGLYYNKRPDSALTISDDIIVINGFSKTHAMTGWRLGWIVVPEELVRPIQKVAQNVFISPPSVSQYAALQAFSVDDDLEMMRKTYRERRDFMIPRLKDMGFTIPVDPEGAFYIYAGIDKWGIDSMEFVERALMEAMVALTPGYDFGSYGAGSHVRFSYANSLEMLKLGCERLEVWLETLK
jgi:aspartate/methionine/tyrosine aminotransferase